MLKYQKIEPKFKHGPGRLGIKGEVQNTINVESVYGFWRFFCPGFVLGFLWSVETRPVSIGWVDEGLRGLLVHRVLLFGKHSILSCSSNRRKAWVVIIC